MPLFPFSGMGLASRSRFIGTVLLGLSWLLPNHYWPWTSYPSEILAGFGLVLLAASVRWRDVQVPRSAVFVAGTALIPLFQAAVGLIYFWGDAWVATLYVAGFAASICTGFQLAKQEVGAASLQRLWVSLLIPGILSVGVCLYQWFGLTWLGIFVADLAPGGRPYGNVAQPNQLATLLIMGAVASCALREDGLISATGGFVVLGVLFLGVAMTGSRTALLEVAVLVSWLIAVRRRSRLMWQRSQLVTIVLILIIALVAWSVMCDVLGRSPGRTVGEQLAAGTRLTHWASILDALRRQPWFGYGWNQVSLAQAAVAANHPYTGEQIEHSHNVLLDLLVWNGLPIGVVLISFALSWLWTRSRFCSQPRVAYALALVFVVCVHAQLEYPLDYAYILFPLGLVAGFVEGYYVEDVDAVVPPRGLLRIVAGTMIFLMGWAVVDYARAESAGRRIRFEMLTARAGTQSPAVPTLYLLTQLSALLKLTAMVPTRNMPLAELDDLRNAAFRFSWSPALSQYALLAAINGRPADATGALQLLCKTHFRQRCGEERAAWAALSVRDYPELKAVAWPELPPSRPAR